MEYLFSSLSNAVKVDLLTSKQKRRTFAMYLLRYVPLSMPSNQGEEADDPVKGLIHCIEHMSNGKSISELADIVLQLGAPYWKLDQSYPFRDLWTTINTGIVCDPPSELESALRADLRDWMTLSIFYSSVFLDDLHIKKNEMNDLCGSSSGNRTFYQRVTNFNRKTPAFLSVFYPNKGIDTTNFLDLEIISTIISSVDYSKNSFLFSDEQPANMPRNPLRLFSGLTLDPKAPSEFLTQLLSYDKNPISRKFDTQICTAYNRFILERISCMNYLSALAKCFLGTGPSYHKYIGSNILRLQWLIDMAASPLFFFRLNFLKYISSIIPTLEIDEHLFAIQLSRYIDYHLRCTIPFLDSLIHFVMGIKISALSTDDKLSFLEKERKQYFNEQPCEFLQKSSSLFEIKEEARTNKKTQEITKKIIPFPKEDPKILFDNDQNHSLQYNFYSTFFFNTIKLAKENFLSNSVKKALQEKQIQIFQENLRPSFQMRSPDEICKEMNTNLQSKHHL